MTDRFAVCVRPICSDESSVFTGSSPAEALEAALREEPEVESVVRWDGQKEMCAVDLDFDRDGLQFTELLVALDGFQPQPCFAWTTHGGGVRLVYVAAGDHTAEEIAAVAASNFVALHPHASVELKHETRHPRGPGPGGTLCSEVSRRQQTFDRRTIAKLLGVRVATDAETAQWLEERGLELGQRYDHAACPVAPSDRGGRRPVLVGENGVMCFVCEAAGVCSGSSKPGFFPYAHLCGSRQSTVLYSMLENGTHWEHAKFFVPNVLGTVAPFARLVYSAGLVEFRGRHDADRCFVAGRDFVRMSDRWTNCCGEPYHGDVKPILAQLPACSFVDENGRVRVDRGKTVVLSQSFDLTKYGYPSAEPIFGIEMWPNENRPGRVVVQTRELSADSAAPLRPMYECTAQRTPEDRVKDEFNACCPGFRWEFLLLLIAARGVAEGAASEPPMVFVTGPTGASKSLSVFLAASVCGDRNTEVVWCPNSDRLRQAVVDATSSGTFVTFNEVLKEANTHAAKNGSAMNFVLNLTPDSMSHYMYVGPVRMGKLPVFVWTDTELPESIKRNAQLARRLVHVHLPSAVDWEKSLKDSGVFHPKRFRVSSERRARVANAVLSHVIDRFFRPPVTFEEIARSLGFGRMIDSQEAEEGREALKTLFETTVAAPEISGVDCVRWKGRGWKVLSRDVETPLREAWATVADPENFFASRAASEADWQRVVGLREPTKLEVRVHGARIALRFRSESGGRTSYRTNGELR